MRGCVYVMRSGHLPGWSKIGFTTRNADQRAAELSTGLPGRLEVYAECHCDDARSGEQQVHQLLHQYRHSARDEWFKIDAVQATKLIRAAFGREEKKRRLNYSIVKIGLATLALLILALLV